MLPYERLSDNLRNTRKIATRTKPEQKICRANFDVKDASALKEKLDEAKKKISELERSKKETFEEQKEIIRIFPEEKEELECVVEHLREDMDDLKEQSISIDVENSMEIRQTISL